MQTSEVKGHTLDLCACGAVFFDAGELTAMVPASVMSESELRRRVHDSPVDAAVGCPRCGEAMHVSTDTEALAWGCVPCGGLMLEARGMSRLKLARSAPAEPQERAPIPTVSQDATSGLFAFGLGFEVVAEAVWWIFDIASEFDL